MNNGITYYKLKLVKKLLQQTAGIKSQLLSELITNATDPTIVKRRLRMIRHLDLYEVQLLEKIQRFETDDVEDLNNFNPEFHLKNIVNRSA